MTYLTLQRQQLQDRLAHKVNFADDLKSIAGCLHSLQEQANLVLAFGLIFGMDQSKSKFRAFQFLFVIPENYRQDAPPLEIVVHTVGWTPTTVAVPAIGALKYLGYYIDTDLGGEAQFRCPPNVSPLL